MRSYYIFISKEFAETMDGKRGISSNFDYAITTDGQYVCSSNSVNDFPEEFAKLEPLTIKSITLDKFPIEQGLPKPDNK